MSHGLARRLTLGISGQAFARVVSSINTILIVPILISAWGLTGYGEWLALTALTSYMAYSNFGLVTTLAYEMVMAKGANDDQRALHTFQMAINISLYLVLPVIVIAMCFLLFLPVADLLHLSVISNGAALLIIGLSAAQIWLQTLRGMSAAALYAAGSYGFTYYVSGSTKLLELLAIAVAVTQFNQSPLAAALVMTGSATLDLVLVTVYTRKVAPWAKIDLTVFDLGWLRKQMKPAVGLAISSFSSQGVLVQGPRVVLGAILGGHAVAVYAIYATAVRLVDQLLLMVVLPVGIEVSRCAGQNDFVGAYRLIASGNRLSLVLYVGVAVGLFVAGPAIFHVWTRDKVAFSYGLLALFLGMSACVQIGRVSWIALVSTNRLYGPSFVSVGLAVVAMAIGGTLAVSLGVSGMVIGSIVGELANAAVVIFVLSRWLEKPVLEMLADMLNIKASMSDVSAFAGKLIVKLRRT